MAIAEDYVSPSVRWGLLKQDYPQAVVEFSYCKGSEIGIPPKFGGDEEYCVASILLREGCRTFSFFRAFWAAFRLAAALQQRSAKSAASKKRREILRVQ